MLKSNLVSINLSLTDLVAIWGGLTGSLSLIISFLNFKRDRAKIKLELRKDWNVINFPGYDPNDLYTSLSVMNVGRRPVTITKGGYVYLKKNGGAILADSMRHGVKELTEGKSVEYLVKQEGINFAEISYFAAYDAVGNTYKKYITNRLKVLLYWLLFKLKIKKKESVL